MQSPSKRRKDDHDHYSYDHNQPRTVGPPVAAYGYSPGGTPPQHFYHQPHYSPTVGPPSSYQNWQGQSPHLHQQPYLQSGGRNTSINPQTDYPYEYQNSISHLAQPSQYRENNRASVPNSSQGMKLIQNSHLNHDYPPTRTSTNDGSTTGQHPLNQQQQRGINMLNISSKEVLDAKMQQSLSDENTRGSYRCGRCGVPKKGHVCPYQPKLKRRIDEPLPEMKNAACQVEMDEFLVLRRLNLEIQGYPETYISEPVGDVGYEAAPISAYTNSSSTTTGEGGELVLQDGQNGNVTYPLPP